MSVHDSSNGQEVDKNPSSPTSLYNPQTDVLHLYTAPSSPPPDGPIPPSASNRSMSTPRGSPSCSTIEPSPEKEKERPLPPPHSLDPPPEKAGDKPLRSQHGWSSNAIVWDHTPFPQVASWDNALWSHTRPDPDTSPDSPFIPPLPGDAARIREPIERPGHTEDNKPPDSDHPSSPLPFKLENKPLGCECSNDGRNLVICIDGTSNQFGLNNTNVVELYSQLIKSPHEQLTYYNSGIGTYAKPSWKSWSYLKQKLSHNIDLAIAWNFEKIVLAAYRWLVQNYEMNDRIYLFGFSRGAYQVRALAGMIQKVGLIHKGNEEQIPFAYELYADRKSDKYLPVSKNVLERLRLGRIMKRSDLKAINLALRFKETFSRESVRVHFVGVWDTVSSVGVIRGKTLPLTDAAKHVCIFRHALALDERRVKFLPEYVYGGVSHHEEHPIDQQRQKSEQERPPDVSVVPATETTDSQVGQRTTPRIKEVWFPGTHSDIGGGNQPNVDLDHGKTSFLWMSYEAISGGLQLKPTRVEWDREKLSEVKESLTLPWYILEWLPMKRLSYKDATSTTYQWHRGHGRKIQPGQKIHASIAFCQPSYCPKAALPDTFLSTTIKGWKNLVDSGDNSQMSWAIPGIFEMDIFDNSAASDLINKLVSERNKDLWLHRLAVMSWSYEGRTALIKVPDAVLCLANLLKNESTDVRLRMAGVIGNLRESRSALTVTGFAEVVDDAIKFLLTTIENESLVRSEAVKVLSAFRLDEKQCKRLSQISSPDTFSSLLNDENHHKVQESLRALCGYLEYEGIRGQIFNDDMISILITTVKNAQWVVIREAAKFLQRAMEFDDIRGRVFSDKMVSVLITMVEQDHWLVKREALKVLQRATDFDGLRERVLSPEVISTIRSRLSDDDEDVRAEALRVITASARQTDLCARLLNIDLISAVQRKLKDEAQAVRAEALQLLTVVAGHMDLQSQFLSTDMISAIRRRLNDYDETLPVKEGTVQFLITAADQKDLRGRVFNGDMILALRNIVKASYRRDQQETLKQEILKVLQLITKFDDIRGRVFNDDMVSVLIGAVERGRLLVKREAMKALRCAADHEDLYKRTFNIDIIRRNLNDSDVEVKAEILRFLKIASHHGDLHGRVFDADVISTVQNDLIDDNEYVRSEAFQFLADAAASRDDLYLIIFDDHMISEVRNRLSGSDKRIMVGGLQFLAVATHYDYIRQRVFNEEMLVTFIKTFRENYLLVGLEALEVLQQAIGFADLRGQVFNDDVILELSNVMKYGNWSIMRKALNVVQCAATFEDLRGRVFRGEIVSALVALNNDWFLKREAVKVLKCVVDFEDLHGIVNPSIVSAIFERLHDKDDDVKAETLRFLATAARHEIPCELFFKDKMVSAICTMLKHDDGAVRAEVVRLFVIAVGNDGLRRQIFTPEVTGDLQRMRNDEDSGVREAMLELLAAAARLEHQILISLGEV